MIMLLQELVVAAITQSSKGLITRGDSSCATNYTSPNGLQFQSICGYDTPCAVNATDCDLINYTNITSLTNCEDICAFSQDVCYGVAYDSTRNRCWLKGSVISSSMAKLDGGAAFNSALVNRTQLTPPSDLLCPYPDNSTVTTPDGAAFQVFCSSDFNDAADYVPYNYPGRYHADTLDQCLKYCDAAHPLCNAVAWNIGLENGYANCFLKHDLPDNAVPSTGSQLGDRHIHSARLLPSNKQRINSSVPQNSAYTSSNGASFLIRQTTARTGASNYTVFHTDNITTCMDGCSQNSTCKGVVLDLSLDNGYNNCYLLDNTGNASNGTSLTTFAQKDSASVNDNNDNSNSGSGSKAWIVGAVIGPLALIAILVAAFFLWRRRQRKQKYSTVNTAAPEYDTDEKRAGVQPQLQPYYHTYDTAVHELSGDKNPRELAAQNDPQELPGYLNDHTRHR